MFRLYSKGCEYAIRALICAAEQTEGATELRFQAKDVCERANIPESFTRKILQALVQNGILDSGRGPGGGSSLSRPANEITLGEIIRSVDGPDAFTKCVMGLAECDKDNPCPMHDYWKSMKTPMMEQLEARTLQDLMTVAERYKSSGGSPSSTEVANAN